MRRRSSNASGRSSTLRRRRSENLRFDEFGFAVLTKRKDLKLYHRCHEYSFPQLSSLRVKELCELLSYWNGASFLCKSQIERFIRMGIPSSLRGRVWKCLLAIDSLRDSSDFNYQKCLSEVRGPLVDLGVSEYGILSAIATLSETQNDLGLNQQHTSTSTPLSYSVDDITLFRQIALDLQRSFPTHRSLMGDSPEAIEGQAKLFRVLLAYAKYSPLVGYSQGMSYIAAVLLMQFGEEEAFWALTALLDKPKYLAELFDLSLTKMQHQVKVFDQFLKHRKPKLSQHLESVGVSSLHFVMPWFLTLFSSLPCWDSVLAVWDLIVLYGLPAVFRTALTIMELMEPRLMELNDEGAVLPLLLRVPVDVAQYTVLVPALWKTEVQDWELKCMNSLVLDESQHTEVLDQREKQAVVPPPTNSSNGGPNTNLAPPSDRANSDQKDPLSRAKGVLTRVVRLAQRYLVNPMRSEEKGASQRQTKPRQHSPRRASRSRVSASLTQTQIKTRKTQLRGGGAHPPGDAANTCDITAAPVPVEDAAGCVEADRWDQPFQRSGTVPVHKAARRRSSRGPAQPARVKSLHALRNRKKPSQSGTTSSTLPPPSSAQPPRTAPCSAPHQLEAARSALVKELSCRHQTSVPFRNIRESQLI